MNTYLNNFDTASIKSDELPELKIPDKVDVTRSLYSYNILNLKTYYKKFFLAETRSSAVAIDKSLNEIKTCTSKIYNKQLVKECTTAKKNTDVTTTVTSTIGVTRSLVFDITEMNIVYSIDTLILTSFQELLRQNLIAEISSAV